jgi:hypothetical protein
MSEHRSRNRALVRFMLLPMIFLTVALMGGLRIDATTKAFVFIPPPLITLLLSVLLMVLFVRGHMINIKKWLSSDQPPLMNVSHALTLLTLFFGSAQAFNSVLPENGLLFWLFSFFFLWTLWNNQFSSFDARRLLRSLGVLFGTAFVLKHMFLAALYAPEGGWLKRFTNLLLEGITLGTLDSPAFAPATGYISFFTLALYVAGLILLAPEPQQLENEEARKLVHAYLQLPTQERLAVREAIIEEASDVSIEDDETQPQLLIAETNDDIRQRPSEETVITPKP